MVHIIRRLDSKPRAVPTMRSALASAGGSILFSMRRTGLGFLTQNQSQSPVGTHVKL
ncbi:hypothetical protein [Roseimaritima multifibrata]|uniref:hypothetical protein n=1 Tax=Roseimaritima multifibrata TaxID=1930274 RepID=UPI001C54FAFC|nr:hypothetical protein [Roseimaritima multifibrata]